MIVDWRDHITVNPNVCHGKPCVKGTRVMVSGVLDNLASGETPADIATAYHITEEDIAAALHFAAELAKERVVPIPSTN